MLRIKGEVDEDDRNKVTNVGVEVLRRFDFSKQDDKYREVLKRYGGSNAGDHSMEKKYCALLYELANKQQPNLPEISFFRPTE